VFVKISLARLLKVKPQAAKKFITVLAGSVVEKGDVVAKKKGFFGKEIIIKSKIAGLVDHYSSDTGELVIKTESNESTEESSVEKEKKTEVSEKKNENTDGIKEEKKTENIEKSSIEKEDFDKAPKATKISKNGIKGVFGFGKGEGKLEICDDCLEFTKLNKDDAGKVILSKTISSSTVLYKASALGVSGLAVLYSRFKPKSKDIGFLVLSDKEDINLWKKLKKWEGKMVRVEREEITCV